MAKSISDVSWYELTRQLEYKAEWNKRKYVKINTFYASSQLCSVCGYQNTKTKRDVYKRQAKVVGEKSIEMIPVKDITAVTGYVRGGCSPIGMKKQYPTYIQESAGKFDEIYVSGGRIGTTLCLNPDDLKEVSHGAVSYTHLDVYKRQG